MSLPQPKYNRGDTVYMIWWHSAVPDECERCGQLLLNVLAGPDIPNVTEYTVLGVQINLGLVHPRGVMHPDGTRYLLNGQTTLFDEDILYATKEEAEAAAEAKGND